jgi:hypothetical protein
MNSLEQGRCAAQSHSRIPACGWFSRVRVAPPSPLLVPFANGATEPDSRRAGARMDSREQDTGVRRLVAKGFPKAVVENPDEDNPCSGIWIQSRKSCWGLHVGIARRTFWESATGEVPRLECPDYGSRPKRKNQNSRSWNTSSEGPKSLPQPLSKDFSGMSSESTLYLHRAATTEQKAGTSIDIFGRSRLQDRADQNRDFPVAAAILRTAAPMRSGSGRIFP